MQGCRASQIHEGETPHCKAAGYVSVAKHAHHATVGSPQMTARSCECRENSDGIVKVTAGTRFKKLLPIRKRTPVVNVFAVTVSAHFNHSAARSEQQ